MQKLENNCFCWGGDTERLSNIDLIKVIGCMSVVLYHLCCCMYSLYKIAEIPLYVTFSESFKNGVLAPDLFFIVSGLFFALRTDFFQPISKFIIKKVKYLWPSLIFALIISDAFSFLGIINFDLIGTIIVLLGLSGTPLALYMGEWEQIHVFWYVSSMLWSFIFYYFLNQLLDKKWVCFITFLTVFISYAILMQNHWGIFEYNWQPALLLRGLGGIGLGYFIGQWFMGNYENIYSAKYKMSTKLIYSVWEILALYMLINILFFNGIKILENYILYVIIFSINIILFLLKRGYVSELCDNKIFSFLAKYTYDIYIIHGLIIVILFNSIRKTFESNITLYPGWAFLIILVVIIFGGIICSYISNKIRYFLK